MSTPTLTPPVPPATVYLCPCCIEHCCPCGGRKITATRCVCCETPELVTRGSARGQVLPCVCGGAAFPERRP